MYQCEEGIKRVIYPPSSANIKPWSLSFHGLVVMFDYSVISSLNVSDVSIRNSASLLAVFNGETESSLTS